MAREANADYFVIERSEYQAASFVTIDTVSTKGNSPDVMRYCYADAFKSNKRLYYQLQQADKDKKFDYSSMISVSSASESEAGYIQTGYLTSFISILENLKREESNFLT